MLPQLNTGKMSWCGGLSCATVLARDWSRVARCLQPAFRRQQSNSTLLLVALLPTDEQNCHRFSSYGSAHPSMSARRRRRTFGVSVFLLSLVSYTPLAPLGFARSSANTQPLLQQDWTSVAKMRAFILAAAISSRAASLDAVRHRIAAPGRDCCSHAADATRAPRRRRRSRCQQRIAGLGSRHARHARAQRGAGAGAPLRIEILPENAPKSAEYFLALCRGTLRARCADYDEPGLAQEPPPRRGRRSASVWTSRASTSIW